MATFTKRLVASILSISVFSQTVHASITGDYIRAADASKKKFWELTHQIIELERKTYAPTFAQDGLISSLYFTNQYINYAVNDIENYSRSLNEVVQKINTLLGTIESTATRQPSLANLELLIKSERELKVLIEQGKHLSSKAARNEELIGFMTEAYNSFCDKAVPELELAMMVPSPNNFLVSPRYLQTNAARFWNEDPVARGYAIVGGAVTLVAGIAVYALIEEMTFVAAASQLAAESSLTAAGGEVTLGVSSAGAFLIVAAAVAMAYTIGKAQAEAENAERLEEAKKAFRSLVEEITRAQKFYEDNRISTAEFQSVAMDSCKNMANLIDPSTGQPGILFTQIEKWKELSGKLKSQIQENKNFADNLDAVRSSFVATRENYTSALNTLFGKQLVEKHLAAVRSKLKVAEGWEYYNTSIKPKSDELFQYYLDNRTNCVGLKQRKLSFDRELEVHFGFIRETYKDSLNAQDPFFAEVEKLGKGISARFEEKSSRCSSGGHDALPPEILFL